jgi:hypothetical protein
MRLLRPSLAPQELQKASLPVIGCPQLDKTYKHNLYLFCNVNIIPIISSMSLISIVFRKFLKRRGFDSACLKSKPPVFARSPAVMPFFSRSFLFLCVFSTSSRAAGYADGGIAAGTVPNINRERKLFIDSIS